MKMFILGVIVGFTLPFVIGFFYTIAVFLWGDWSTFEIFRKDRL